MTTHLDENLTDACHRLDHAASGLFGPRHAVHAGRTVTGPSLWEELQQERYARGGKAHTANTMKSTPVAKLHLLDLADEIEAGIRGWADDPEASLTELVDLLATPQAWRPQDAGHVMALASQLDAWRERVHDELEGGSRLEVRARCPQCNARYFYEQRDDGTTTRTSALVVTTVQARCLCCAATWPPTAYGLLIRVIEQQDAEQ